jgi:hypothetical protein
VMAVRVNPLGDVIRSSDRRYAAGEGSALSTASLPVRV